MLPFASGNIPLCASRSVNWPVIAAFIVAGSNRLYVGAVMLV